MLLKFSDFHSDFLTDFHVWVVSACCDTLILENFREICSLQLYLQLFICLENRMVNSAVHKC